MSAVALLKEPCGPDDAEVKEFMSGNICRCGAYQNIVAAIQECAAKRKRRRRDENFQLTRPKDSAQAIAAAGEDENSATGSGYPLHRRRHDVDRLDEAQCRAAAKFGRSQPAAARQNRGDSGWRPNDRCHGAQFGAGLAPARAQELRGSFRSDLERRDGADSQHGDDCRQFVATDALHVFPRSRDAV